MKAKIDALTVSCPQCGADVGDRCWSGTRRGHKLARGSHRGRQKRAAGEDVNDDFGVWLQREIRRAQQDALSGKKP